MHTRERTARSSAVRPTVLPRHESNPLPIGIAVSWSSGLKEAPCVRSHEDEGEEAQEGGRRQGGGCCEGRGHEGTKGEVAAHQGGALRCFCALSYDIMLDCVDICPWNLLIIL